MVDFRFAVGDSVTVLRDRRQQLHVVDRADPGVYWEVPAYYCKRDDQHAGRVRSSRWFREDDLSAA